MVSPWQKNGTLLDYLKANPNCDRIALVNGIGASFLTFQRCSVTCMQMHGVAGGLKVLHTWFPKSIVHGSIRAASIHNYNQFWCRNANLTIAFRKTFSLAMKGIPYWPISPCPRYSSLLHIFELSLSVSPRSLKVSEV